jgi:general secretion pathway protein I
MNRLRVSDKASGFTLIESVVALIIVALGMMAVFTQLNQFAMTAVFVQQKTLASWIASNRLTELSIQNQWPEIGTEEDEVEFAGYLWRYEVEISATDVDNLRRADVFVYLEDQPERLIHQFSALIEPPPPRGFAPLTWLTTGGEQG